MAKTTGIAKWLRQVLEADPPRSKSLMMTVFGDSLVPCGSGIWLGELVQLMEPLGVNERLVRTSGFRLVEEGWLQTERQGRRSRYSLTASGRQRVQHAHHRIYDPPPSHWDGKWLIILPRKSQSSPAERLQLRRELEWEGFGTLAPGMFVHPRPDLVTVREILDRLQLTGSLVLLHASELGLSTSSSGLVADGWSLNQVRSRYEAFLQAFDPALGLVRQGTDPTSAFLIQTLLIHRFRRVVLHDPRLPGPLLPDGWPGHRAYELCREIYRLTHPHAFAFLEQHVEEIRERPELVRRELLGRFGGLDGVAPAANTLRP